MAASISTSSTDERDGRQPIGDAADEQLHGQELMDRIYRASAAFLRPDAQILPARPRPADPRAGAAGTARTCWRSAAAPAATSSRRPGAYPAAPTSTGSTSRARCWRPRAPNLRQAGLADRIAWPGCADAADSTRGSCSGGPVRPRLLLLQPVDDPALARGAGPRRGPRRARRPALPGRFRPAGAPARWFRRLLFAWLRRFHVSPPINLPDAVQVVAAELGREARFETLYRDYACVAEIAKVR